MVSLALGTKVFSRIEDLRELLETRPDVFDTVYIADDGSPSPEKERLYEQTDATVLDLAYDAGVGAGRNAVASQASEDYLCIVDPDHRVPPNITQLVDQLESRPGLGAVGGVLAEPEQNRIRYEGHDFAEEDDGNTLIRSPWLRDKRIEVISGAPFILFAFIPNAAVFRREVLAEYPWDEHFVCEGEHLDYYLTHWKESDWSFGINPGVQFLHYPGGDEDYLAKRHSSDRERASKQYLMNKWEYEEIELDSYSWRTITGQRQIHPLHPENIRQVLREDGVAGTLAKGLRYARGLVDNQDETSW